jgi:hypothetical protein
MALASLGDRWMDGALVLGATVLLDEPELDQGWGLGVRESSFVSLERDWSFWKAQSPQNPIRVA